MIKSKKIDKIWIVVALLVVWIMVYAPKKSSGEPNCSKKREEPTGQSIHYTRMTKATPRLVIICRNKKEVKKFNKTIERHKLNIELWGVNCDGRQN